MRISDWSSDVCSSDLPPAGDLPMSHDLLAIAITLAQILLLLAMGFSIMRMVRGPRAQDRVVALDALYVNAMILLLTIGIRTGSLLYVEAGLIIALLGFASPVALPKFLIRGQLIEVANSMPFRRGRPARARGSVW